MSVLVAAVQVRLFILIAHLLLAPYASAQRLLPFDDASAGVLFRGVVALAWLWGFLDVLAFFLQRFGMAREPFLLLMLLCRIFFAVLFLSLVWRLRAPIAA